LAKLYKLWLFEQTVSISMKVSGNSGGGASYARLYNPPPPPPLESIVIKKFHPNEGA
jgi:hypothetical protein